MDVKRLVFSDHARQQMAERGASEAEVAEAIVSSEGTPAKRGRVAYRRNFQYNRTWGGKLYRIKQVMPIVKEEHGSVIVITIYTFYF